MGSEELLRLEHVGLHFPVTFDILGKPSVTLKAVDDVSLSLRAGETLGIVGESGSGKTTLGRTIARLYKPTAGRVIYHRAGAEVDLARLDRRAMKPYRREIQMLFQDPNASLNARLRIGDIVAEPLEIHGVGTTANRRDRVVELLGKVGLGPETVNRYPHQLSGGQRQRVGIARALTVSPRLLICDEPVSALDVSVQAQVLNLLKQLQRELGMAYLFIAHDLAVVDYVSDRIAVMYLGRIVELAKKGDLVSRPAHPYSAALLNAVPRGMGGKRAVLTGDVPSPISPPSGCVFRNRCPHSVEICARERPILSPLARMPATLVACHRADELNLTTSVLEPQPL